MKENYTSPEIEITVFETEDVITISVTAQDAAENALLGLITWDN